MDDDLRALERASVNTPDLVPRLARAVERAGGIPYALDRLTREPDSSLWRDVYIAVGGVYVRLVNDNMLGESIRITLPDYEGRREDLIVGINNLEDGPQDIETMLTRYTSVAIGGTRQDGVIVMPLRLEIAIAKAMHTIRDIPLFSREQLAYRDSFVISVQQSQPAYGKIIEGNTLTNATLDELTLDGTRVRHDINIPSVGTTPCIIIAPEEGENQPYTPGFRDLRELDLMMRSAIEESLEQIGGEKTPGLILQTFATQQNGRKRPIVYATAEGDIREEGSESVLGLGCIDYTQSLDAFYVDVCGGENGPLRYTRGCRRAKVPQ